MGVAAVLIAILLSGLIDLKIIIKNPAGQLCSTIACFYVSPALFCVIVTGKKSRKISLLVTGINLNADSRERSSFSASEDMSLLQHEDELWF